MSNKLTVDEMLKEAFILGAKYQMGADYKDTPEHLAHETFKSIHNPGGMLVIKTEAQLSQLVNEIIGENEPTFGAQNEAGDISEDDYITYGRNSVRSEQRTRAIERGFTLTQPPKGGE